MLRTTGELAGKSVDGERRHSSEPYEANGEGGGKTGDFTVSHISSDSLCWFLIAWFRLALSCLAKHTVVCPVP